MTDAAWMEQRHSCDYAIYKTCDYSGNLAAIHWRELAEKHPEAKFILPHRPLDAWVYKQIKHRYHIRNRIKLGEASWDYWNLTRTIADPLGISLEEIGLTLDRDAWELVYNTHVDSIRNYFESSPDRLLELNVFEEPPAHIWERLGDFFWNRPPLAK